MPERDPIQPTVTQSTTTASVPPPNAWKVRTALALAATLLTLFGSVVTIRRYLFERVDILEPLAIVKKLDMPATAVITLDASDPNQWQFVRRTLDILYALEMFKYKTQTDAGESASKPEDLRTFKKSMIAFGLPARVIVGFRPTANANSGVDKFSGSLVITCLSRGVNAVRLILTPNHHSTVLPQSPKAELYLPADSNSSIVGVAHNCVVMGGSQSIVRKGLIAVARAARDTVQTGDDSSSLRKWDDWPGIVLRVTQTETFRKLRDKTFLSELLGDCGKAAICSDTAFVSAVAASQKLLDNCESIRMFGTTNDDARSIKGVLECSPANGNQNQAKNAVFAAPSSFKAVFEEIKPCTNAGAVCIAYTVRNPLKILFWPALTGMGAAN